MGGGKGITIFHQAPFYDSQHISQTWRFEKVTMVFVEIDTVLYTMWKKVHKSQDKFMQLLKEKGKIIIAHRRSTGYHPKIYK